MYLPYSSGHLAGERGAKVGSVRRVTGLTLLCAMVVLGIFYALGLRLPDSWFPQKHELRSPVPITQGPDGDAVPAYNSQND
jgi:hypothetical protein